MASHLSRPAIPCLFDAARRLADDLAGTLAGAVAPNPAGRWPASDIVVTMVPNGEVVRCWSPRSGPAPGLRAGRAAARHLSSEPWLTEATAAALAGAASPWWTRRCPGRSGAPQAAELVFMGGGAAPTSSGSARSSTGWARRFSRRQARRRPWDEVPQQHDHGGEPAGRDRRAGDGQALRPRPGGDGRRAERLHRHVVGVADAPQASASSAAASTTRSSWP